MVFFNLATSIVIGIGRGRPKVPQPYARDMVDSNKYGKKLEERMVDTRDSGNLLRYLIRGLRHNIIIYAVYKFCILMCI